MIPPLANRDWRAVARQRKGQQVYVPDGFGVSVGEDGTQGGLGTRDTINSGPQASGLVHRRQEEVETTVVESLEISSASTPAVELDEDERARQALLASVSGEATQETTVDVIPVLENNVSRPISETDAYRQDVITRPDSVSCPQFFLSLVKFLILHRLPLTIMNEFQYLSLVLLCSEEWGGKKGLLLVEEVED